MVYYDENNVFLYWSCLNTSIVSGDRKSAQRDELYLASTCGQFQDVVVNEQHRNTIWDNDDESIFGPSGTSTKSLFSATDVQAILESCKEVIKAGPISQKRIAESLQRCPETASLMAKYTIAQIISRIKYERRKLRLNKPEYMYFSKTG
jgi:hypothetical protein